MHFVLGMCFLVFDHGMSATSSSTGVSGNALPREYVCLHTCRRTISFADGHNFRSFLRSGCWSAATVTISKVSHHDIDYAYMHSGALNGPYAAASKNESVVIRGLCFQSSVLLSKFGAKFGFTFKVQCQVRFRSVQ